MASKSVQGRLIRSNFSDNSEVGLWVVLSQSVISGGDATEQVVRGLSAGPAYTADGCRFDGNGDGGGVRADLQALYQLVQNALLERWQQQERPNATAASASTNTTTATTGGARNGAAPAPGAGQRYASLVVPGLVPNIALRLGMDAGEPTTTSVSFNTGPAVRVLNGGIITGDVRIARNGGSGIILRGRAVPSTLGLRVDRPTVIGGNAGFGAEMYSDVAVGNARIGVDHAGEALPNLSGGLLIYAHGLAASANAGRGEDDAVAGYVPAGSVVGINRTLAPTIANNQNSGVSLGALQNFAMRHANISHNQGHGVYIAYTQGLGLGLGLRKADAGLPKQGSGPSDLGPSFRIGASATVDAPVPGVAGLCGGGADEGAGGTTPAGGPCRGASGVFISHNSLGGIWAPLLSTQVTNVDVHNNVGFGLAFWGYHPDNTSSAPSSGPLPGPNKPGDGGGGDGRNQSSANHGGSGDGEATLEAVSVVDSRVYCNSADQVIVGINGMQPKALSFVARGNRIGHPSCDSGGFGIYVLVTGHNLTIQDNTFTRTWFSAVQIGAAGITSAGGGSASGISISSSSGGGSWGGGSGGGVGRGSGPAGLNWTLRNNTEVRTEQGYAACTACLCSADLVNTANSTASHAGAHGRAPDTTAGPQSVSCQPDRSPLIFGGTHGRAAYQQLTKGIAYTYGSGCSGVPYSFDSLLAAGLAGGSGAVTSDLVANRLAGMPFDGFSTIFPRDFPPRTRVLRMNGIGLARVDFAALARLTDLEVLDLGRNPALNPFATSALGRLPRIRSLTLAGVDLRSVTNATFQGLRHTLQALDVSRPSKLYNVSAVDVSFQVRVVGRSTSPQWGPVRFRPPICKYTPWGVRVDERANQEKYPPENIYRSCSLMWAGLLQAQPPRVVRRGLPRRVFRRLAAAVPAWHAVVRAVPTWDLQASPRGFDALGLPRLPSGRS